MEKFNNNNFVLMNKDIPILGFEIRYDRFGTFKLIENQYYSNIRPHGFLNITQWLQGRQAPKHREHIVDLLKRCGCYDLEAYIRITHALTLNDTFWIKEDESKLKWNDVSLYSNNFNEVIAKIAFEGGMYGEEFSSTSPEFGTDGTFAKCWIRENDKIYLMKAGSTGARNSGLEPFSEMYSSQIASKICRNTVKYSVEKYRGKIASRCELFTSESEGFVTASKFMPKYFNTEELMNLYSEYGCEDDFRRMLVLDVIIVNVDRHMGNHGFIIDNDTLEIRRMAPIFDNNMALLPYAEEQDFNDNYKYFSEQKPKIGKEFCETANKVLTKSIKSDLLNLRYFKFDTSGNYNLSEERIGYLNDLIQLQIKGILDYKQYYIKVNQPNEQEYINENIYTDEIEIDNSTDIIP